MDKRELLHTLKTILDSEQEDMPYETIISYGYTIERLEKELDEEEPKNRRRAYRRTLRNIERQAEIEQDEAFSAAFD